MTSAPLPPGKLTGNETQLVLQSPYGNTPVPWLDLSLDSLAAIGKSFIKPALPPDEIAERQWNLGNFALVIGRVDAARELLNAAAEAKPDFKDAVEQLLPAPEKKPEEKK